MKSSAAVASQPRKPSKNKDLFAKLPPGQKPRWVNSRRFQLEYDVESVGPSGVAHVELWGTRDGGKLWTSFGLDDDKRSPFVIMVEDEGLYGFRIAVESGAGVGGDPPPADAPADIWIGVDLTKPACAILSTEPMTGEPAGRLFIRWEADDIALIPKPISLYQSEFRDGPWKAIATELENNGQYVWTADNRGSMRLYLRLEAKDEAGNLGIFETPEPITLDRARPSVRIREIRPVPINR